MMETSNIHVTMYADKFVWTKWESKLTYGLKPWLSNREYFIRTARNADREWTNTAASASIYRCQELDWTRSIKCCGHYRSFPYFRQNTLSWIRRLSEVLPLYPSNCGQDESDKEVTEYSRLQFQLSRLRSRILVWFPSDKYVIGRNFEGGDWKWYTCKPSKS